MTFWQAIILGLIQGVTEFLPVSSSGHLYLSEKFLNIDDGSLIFKIILHLATLLAVFIFFWPKIKSLSKKNFLTLLFASLPLIPVTILTYQIFDSLTRSLIWIALFLIITAVLNFLSFLKLRKKEKKSAIKNFHEISPLTALKIGFFQAFGIFPGISRSGITLFASLSSNLQAEIAFQFSFLLSIPAIVGSLLFDLLRTNGDSLKTLNWSLALPAMFSAFLSGLASLKILRGLIKHNRFLFFALYCLFLALVLIVFN
jgi:undecaprenyl-diphosphatase